jgi:AcrR family transcriptional regulator
MTPRHKAEHSENIIKQTRERIINAAVEEFAREGYDGVSVKRITQTARVATGTIYNYFPSKHGLMLALLEEIGSAHCAYIAKQVRQEGDVIERVKKLFEAGFAFVREHPRQARVLFTTLQGANTHFKAHLSRIYQPMFQLISADILLPGIQRGIFQSLDPVDTATMIMTFYLGIGATVDENGETPLNLNEVAAFVLRALGAAPAAIRNETRNGEMK